MTRFFRCLTPSSPVAHNNWTIQNIDSIVAHFVLAIQVTDYELAVDDHLRHLDRGWIERDICGNFLIFVFWVVSCAGVGDYTSPSDVLAPSIEHPVEFKLFGLQDEAVLSPPMITYNPETYTPRALQNLLDESERALHQSETSRTTESATQEAQLATLEKTLASLQRRATRFETERPKLSGSREKFWVNRNDFEYASSLHAGTATNEIGGIGTDSNMISRSPPSRTSFDSSIRRRPDCSKNSTGFRVADEPIGNDLASEIRRSFIPDHKYTSESGLGRTPRALRVHLEEILITSPTESEGSHEYNEWSIEATSYTSSSDATILSPLIITAVAPLSASESNIGGRTPVSRQIELPAAIEKSASTTSEEPEEEYNNPSSSLFLRSEGVVMQEGPSVSPSSGISEIPEDASSSTPSSLAILLSDVEARPEEGLNDSPRSSFSETTQDTSTASSATIRPHDVRRLVDEGVQTAPPHVLSSQSMLEIQGILTYARHPDEAKPPSTHHELQLTADAIVHYHAPMQWPMKPDAVAEVETAERWKALKQDLAHVSPFRSYELVEQDTSYSEDWFILLLFGNIVRCS
ncbi:uncharacterized protein STEHIDRAFT_159196 [Stereum hirsutum FP-91666 SS1]|uniref:uncharacterized protein n=1 Tax=Stereum hirsutum (strain FP-91666) TaxID=721885 RepID=UPI000444A8C9|nr:uncharacterized protein STEHIDRAFT_159196 [Stereum hirsutum FP-91666 SS1]EIM84529.1 hypothetical protein STEHIDRAFT_159196 [Stereum hirsutum FP-91666 SS1]